MSVCFTKLTKGAKCALLLGTLLGFNGAFAHGDTMSQEEIQKTVNAFMKNIVVDNLKHVQHFDIKEASEYAQKQTPRATILICCDSRIDTSVFDETRINDHFVVRNIGNQIETAEGSIEYGVTHLHTPVLLIVGHSGCGAVTAAMGDFSKESEKIQKELRDIDVKDSKNLDEAILKNVHDQVSDAHKKFSDLVEKGELTIVGAVYDFRNDFKRDHGRLILLNINGEQDVEKIKGHPILKDVEGVTVGAGL